MVDAPSPVMTVPQRELGVGDTGSPSDWYDSLTNEKDPELR